MKINKFFILIIINLFLVIFLLGCQQLNQMGNVKEKKYIGYSDATNHGYAWAQVTKKNDDITDIKLMEITAKGNYKDFETYKYKPSIKAHQKMPGQFEKGESAQIDDYTKATHSSQKYKQAVTRALKIAKGNLEGKYFNGKFQGSSKDKDEYGHAIALIEIKKEDDITAVELKEVSSEGKFKDFSNYKYKPVIKAIKEMTARFEKANSANVDTYTGATNSSQKYIEAVNNALLHASKNHNKYNEKKNDVQKETEE